MALILRRQSTAAGLGVLPGITLGEGFFCLKELK
jgi:hypothetical protein